MITKSFKEEIDFIDNKIYTIIEKVKHPIVKGETRRLIATGGKRLRPLFLLWAASYKGTLYEDSYTAAASLELLHTSSLIHDDIIDASYFRRGDKTTLNIFGRERAASIGTILSLFSINQIVSLGNDHISNSLADTLENLCNGELKQLDERYDFNSSFEDYFDKISHKTASLFALPCKIGALISRYEDSEVDKLYKVGYNIGCSFQILDDIKDITSNINETGKEANEDLKNGIVTLPYLLLMESDPIFKNSIKKLSANSPDKDFTDLLNELKSSEAIKESYNKSNFFLSEARNILSTLKPSDSIKKFQFIIDCLYKKDLN